jgi:hypothetical protein
MKNKVSYHRKKIYVLLISIIVLSSSLLIFTSCKSNYLKASTNNNLSCCQVNQTSAGGNNSTSATGTIVDTTNTEGQQIIEVIAGSGGYSPSKIEARSGVPTILIMKSEDAYGCERAFNLPDLNTGAILPENGETQFDLGIQVKGTELLGVCSMGMYYFQIYFS